MIVFAPDANPRNPPDTVATVAALFELAVIGLLLLKSNVEPVGTVSVGVDTPPGLVKVRLLNRFHAFESVAKWATRRNIGILHAELVGLLPADVLDGIPEGRWEELDLSADRTIESRLKARGISR